MTRKSHARRNKDNGIEALRMTIGKLRTETEEIQEKGGIPHDYSLGFLNAMIFAEHRISGRVGDPILYSRTTSIGKMVKPSLLESDAARNERLSNELEMQRFQAVVDDVVSASSNLLTSLGGQECRDPLAIEQHKKLDVALRAYTTFCNDLGDTNEQRVPNEVRTDSDADQGTGEPAGADIHGECRNIEAGEECSASSERASSSPGTEQSAQAAN